MYGIRRPFTAGAKAVGAAVTLQFLRKREDVEPGRQEEETESRSDLCEAVIATGGGDVPVVDARGDLETECVGEMLLTAIHVVAEGKGCEDVH